MKNEQRSLNLIKATFFLIFAFFFTFCTSSCAGAGSVLAEKQPSGQSQASAEPYAFDEFEGPVNIPNCNQNVTWDKVELLQKIYQII